MSFIDAAFLKKSDIQNCVLSYRRHKTGQSLHIKVVKQIEEIINRYSNKDSPYLLPVITRPGEDERRQYETALRRVNNHNGNDQAARHAYDVCQPPCLGNYC